jgi:AcrR family transcriptional regulator
MSRASTAKKGPPQKEVTNLTRERVCREALALVDEEGLQALSMRRLGARLGVEAMSLYRHVQNKADLLDAIHAAVLGDLRPVDIGDTTDWRLVLGGFARALRAALLRHPNVVSLFATRAVRAPEAMQVVQQTWYALDYAGFTQADARRAVIVVGVFVVGHVLTETQGEPAAHLGVPGGPGADEFEFGLEAMLDGIAARLNAPSTPRRPRRGRKIKSVS